MTPSLESDLTAAGGLALRRDLVLRGHPAARIDGAIRRGELQRPRRGWVRTMSAAPDAVRAVELGGRLGGASALRSYGIWVDEHPGLIVATEPTASRLPPLGPGEHRVWMADRFPQGTRQRWRSSVADALLHYSTSVGLSSLVASVDSALHRGLLDVVDLERLLDVIGRNRRHRRIRERVDGRAMSGMESHMRLLLRAAGFRVELQVSIPLVGVVDLLIDGWLIVELDSIAHHGGPDAQLRDRSRDALALLQGMTTVRFLPQQLFWEPERCLDIVREAHRRGPGPGFRG